MDRLIFTLFSLWVVFSFIEGTGSQDVLWVKVKNDSPYLLEHLAIYSNSQPDLEAYQSSVCSLDLHTGKTIDDLISFTVKDMPFSAYLPDHGTIARTRDTLRINLSGLDRKTGIFQIDID